MGTVSGVHGNVPESDLPWKRCHRLQRISGAEATHFLWPGGREAMPHSPPLLAALISGSSACPIVHPGEAARPQAPSSPSFGSWKLESLTGSDDASPFPWEAWTSSGQQ